MVFALDGLDEDARRLGTWLIESGGRRFRPSDLRMAFREVSPTSAGRVGRFRLLGDALTELATAGIVELSATTEATGTPALPTEVRLLTPVADARVAGPPVMWHPELSDADGRPDPRGILRAVNAWLFDGGTRAEQAPLRERALEITRHGTADEKAFDGQLHPLLEDLRILRAYRVVPPLYRRPVGDGPVLLVVENVDTYDSLCRVLEAGGSGSVGEVAWGAGSAFESSVLSLCDRPPEAIRYFGDLDAAGLRIPAAASVLAEENGLPPVRPADGLYDLLFAHGIRQDRAPVPAGRAETLAAWLAPTHHDAAANLLETGARLAQEAVTRPLLTRTAEWRST